MTLAVSKITPLNQLPLEQRLITAESRVLYVTIKKLYGSFNKFAQYFGFNRQYCQEMMKKGVPIQYASYISRKNGFRPALLNYKLYLLMGGKMSFKRILLNEIFFSAEEKKYILKGRRIRSVQRFLKEYDEEFLKK